MEKRAWDHAVELVLDAKPANCKVYPISPLEQKELDAFIAEGLSTGCIHPSKSPMASLFFIKKKDRALRFVQDYQALNAMTVKNRYPLPLINDLINCLKRARFFTKLDVWWDFNNVWIREGDKWKAVFRTNRGLFKPLVILWPYQLPSYVPDDDERHFPGPHPFRRRHGLPGRHPHRTL
jgi:hypothetical protein